MGMIRHYNRNNRMRIQDIPVTVSFVLESGLIAIAYELAGRMTTTEYVLCTVTCRGCTTGFRI
jgi:hypothetical protein